MFCAFFCQDLFDYLISPFQPRKWVLAIACQHSRSFWNRVPLNSFSRPTRVLLDFTQAHIYITILLVFPNSSSTNFLTATYGVLTFCLCLDFWVSPTCALAENPSIVTLKNIPISMSIKWNTIWPRTLIWNSGHFKAQLYCCIIPKFSICFNRSLGVFIKLLQDNGETFKRSS